VKIAVAAVAAVVSLAALIAFTLRPDSVIPFNRGDYLVVTSFENGTGDEDLDVIGEAFQLALLNSTRVNVMQPPAVQDLLRQARLSSDRVDLPAAQAMAARAPSIRVLLAGNVKKEGTGYAITARLLRPDATVLAAFKTSRLDSESIMPAVGKLARQMRRRFGEPVETRANDQVRLVCTDSAAALKLYRDATSLMQNGPLSEAQRATARGLLKQALVNDPAFALARAAFAQLQTSREDRVTQFARAIADAERLEDAERALVTAHAWRGSSLELREPIEQVRAHERAVAASEAVVALQPDNVAALELLALLYDRSSRRADVESLRARVAELVPFSARTQLAMARHHVDRGNYQGAEKYIARVRELDPGERDLPPSQLAWLRMLDAQLAWIANDLQRAAAAADRVQATLAFVEGESRQQLAFHLLSFYLTLGRLQDAGAIVQRVPRDQEWLRALVLSMYDDPSRLRQLLQSRYQDPGLAERVGSLWVDAGLLTNARAVITRTPALSYQGQLALAEGDREEAIRLLTLAMSQMSVYGDPGQFRVARKLAQALVEQGELDRAIAILEAQSTRRNETLSGASSGYEWLRVRAQLAKAYRLAGRVAEAETVEAELETLLALADQDHPIERSLRARHPRRSDSAAR
jgi:tetratricopeptide (TPR) repeat protein